MLIIFQLYVQVFVKLVDSDLKIIDNLRMVKSFILPLKSSKCLHSFVYDILLSISLLICK